MNIAWISSHKKTKAQKPWGRATLAALWLAAIAILIAASGWSYHNGLLWAYSDTTSHVAIPRRMWDNFAPGWEQIGTHWAPLYHLLLLPLTPFSFLYDTGLAGSVVSSLSTLLCLFFIWKIVVLISSQKHALLACAVFLLNPNILYLSTVAMLSTLTMATAIGSIYYLLVWTQSSGRNTKALLSSGLWLSLAMLTHFETWILFPLEGAVILVVSIYQWRSSERAEATILLWASIAAYGMALFFLMNIMIFGDPLSFTKASEGSPSVFGTAHRGLSALLDWPHAALLMLGPIGTTATVIGSAIFMWRTRNNKWAWPVLLLFFPLAWFSFQALSAGSIIEPAHSLGDWRNLRYGATVLGAGAIIPILAWRKFLPAVLTAAVLVGTGVSMAQSRQVASLEDARFDMPSNPVLVEAAKWLKTNVDKSQRGSVLVPVSRRYVDRVETLSGLPQKSFIDANDTAQGPTMLARGSNKPRWVLWLGSLKEDGIAPAVVAPTLHLCFERAAPVLDLGKTLVRIYRQGGKCPAMPPRNVQRGDGFTYGEWGEDALRPDVTKRRLAQLQKLGTKSIIFPVLWLQESLRGTSMRPDRQYTVRDSSLRAAIRETKRLGMNPVLKVYIDLPDHKWRGTIEPRDVDRWFSSYTLFVSRYARIAAQEGATGLITGVEMVSINKYQAQWRALMGTLRSIFPGWVAYQSNWGEATPEVSGDGAVSWWDATDAIALSAYYPLSNKSVPSAQQWKKGWTSYRYAGKNRNWKAVITRLAEVQQRPVVFSEIGFRPRNNVANRPWYNGNKNIDTSIKEIKAQRDAYVATQQVWKGDPWVRSINWWFVNRYQNSQVQGADHIPAASTLKALAAEWKK